MLTVDLNGTWQLTYGPQQTGRITSPGDLASTAWPTIPATVPGNVELDLVAAGKLEEPSVGNRIYALRELETYEWWYSRRFTTPSIVAPQRAELVFEGLDCIGTIWLNDELVGHTDNMLIAHRFDVTDWLKPSGVNELVVRIESAVLEGRRHQSEPVEMALAANWESLSVRKAPHGYGWDIMPRVVSAGLWRGVHLDILEPTRWRSAYWATLKTDPIHRTAEVLVDWDFVTDRADLDLLRVRITLSRAGRVAHRSEHAVLGTHGRAVLPLRDVDLWWPRGFAGPGPAALYEATLDLVDAEADTTIASHTSRIGPRTIELRRTDITTDQQPGEFVFVVNGEKVFAHGTNWVPLDAFHSRDAHHLHDVFEMILDLNCNMIRCWGGNVYEDHEFFELCDGHGIMVWQDFAMACAIYPQTDEFAAKIRTEAEAVVTKLRNHPSLALWAGNNEIDEAFGWAPTRLDPNTDRLSRKVLPEVIRRLDPLRPYLPSSPYRSPELIRRGGDMNLQPEQHLWGPRDDFKGPFYIQSRAHFVSEIGYHGCPDRRSLQQFLDPDHLWPWQDNDQWLTHAVRPLPTMHDYDYRIPLMARQIAVLFDRVPDDLDDYILASQISQAEALKFFIERWRAGKWRRTGMLWWNLRDGWPIISDAVVDYYNRKKLAYHFIKRVQADVCVICAEAEGARHPVVVVNDTRSLACGHVIIADADSERLLLESDFAVEANGKATIGEIPAAERPAMWLIRWTMRCVGAGGGSPPQAGSLCHHSPEGCQAEFRNHYLAGPRPFRLDDYRWWIGKMGTG